MLFTKKEKIKAYLTTKQVRTTFDDILQNWIDKQFEAKLFAMGLTKIDVHIDWFEDYKCVSVQARKGKYFVELQVHPNEFTVGYDDDEADDDTDYRLISLEYFYNTVEQIIVAL